MAGSVTQAPRRVDGTSSSARKASACSANQRNAPAHLATSALAWANGLPISVVTTWAMSGQLTLEQLGDGHQQSSPLGEAGRPPTAAQRAAAVEAGLDAGRVEGLERLQQLAGGRIDGGDGRAGAGGGIRPSIPQRWRDVSPAASTGRHSGGSHPRPGRCQPSPRAPGIQPPLHLARRRAGQLADRRCTASVACTRPAGLGRTGLEGRRSPPGRPRPGATRRQRTPAAPTARRRARNGHLGHTVTSTRAASTSAG